MFKWFKIVKFIKIMRKKHNRYDFRLITTNNKIIIYMTGEDDELRLNY